MDNIIVLSRSTDTAGVVVGSLHWHGECVLSMAHPTTIAAAIFAMGERKVVLMMKTEAVQVPFPIPVADFCALTGRIDTERDADFMIGFAKSSWFDFLNPHPADNKAQAEFHLAAAVSHLPERLVRNGPSSSKSKGVTDELRMGKRLSPFAAD